MHISALPSVCSLALWLAVSAAYPLAAQTQKGTLVFTVESLGAQIDRVGAVRQRCAHGVERAGRREKLGDGEARHNC